MGIQAGAIPCIMLLDARCLISAGALDKVRAVQQMDTCDVEAALVLYTRLLAEVDKNCDQHGDGEPTMSPVHDAPHGVKKPRVDQARSKPLPRFGLRGDTFNGASSDILDEGLDAAQVRAATEVRF